MNPPNNDWLISPPISTGTSTSLSFWAKSITDQYGLERFNVWVSTTGTELSDFTKISSAPYIEAPIIWTNYQYDLSDYSGQNIYVAIQCVSNDAFCFMVDDFEVTSSGAALVTWTGSSDNSWNNPENWSNGVPTFITNVLIPNKATNYPIVEDAAYCKNLEIEEATNLTIGNNGILHVDEELVNNAGVKGLIIQSSSAGTGQIVNNTSTIEATVNQYFKQDGWHYFSTPMTNGLSEVFRGSYLAAYDEAANAEGDWNFIDNTTTPLIPGQGYAVYNNQGENYTITIAGTLNNGDISVSPGYTDENHGWNFIGNPYPCALDWDNSSISKTNINNAIYIWNDSLNEGNGQYVSYNNGISTPEVENGGNSNILAPMQGFFIRTYAAPANITFSNSAKVSNNDVLFKAKSLPSIIRLAVKDNNGNGDETVILTDSRSTENFDSEFDAYKKFHPDPNFPELYSLDHSNQALSINSMPYIDENTTINLAVKSPANGVYEIALKHEIENWDLALPVYLVDKRTGTRHNLMNEAVSFFAEKREVVPFKLVFSDLLFAVGRDDNQVAELQITTNKNSLLISTGAIDQSLLELFDLTGRKVLSQQILGNHTRIETNLNGVYIAKLTTTKASRSVKIILQP